ncbi:RAMP superfamily CRISPR-associated protein [Persephonella sp. IF05-L8]|uniref:RAMP superfamily CRISPR-associated protein n=1 Tax=Persephonella sp. IF05-L8 TaxID=1158338 RepID=UPI00055B8C32
MNKFETLIEINPEKIENLAEYIAYCKYYFKPKSEGKIENYLFKSRQSWYLNRNNKYKFLDEFKFLKKKINNCVENGKGENWCENQLAKKLKIYKSNETLKDFPLSWLKNEIIGERNKYIGFNNDIDIQNIKQISGIYTNFKRLQRYIENLPKSSFAIWFKFRLKAPYFSKDDDEFYIIQNPILKEANFKVPMIRGSAWKGALASAFRELFRKDFSNKKEKIESFLRVFGAGSESIKAIEQALIKETGNFEKAQEGILSFLFFELGLEITGQDLQRAKDIKNKNDLRNFIKDKLSKKLNDSQKDLPIEFQTHKGRAIFYPTYFDKLSLEIINPHDRRKRAGTNPIHYEVVPEGVEGIFQLIYIPFDAVLKSDKEVREEAKEDLANIIKALRVLSNKGIGAKTKLGWGRFEIRYLSCFRNFS